VNPSGTKSYRCVYYFPGDSKPHWKKLGRVGVMSLEEAREATRDTQRQAGKGDDPTSNDPNKSDKFAVCVEDYIVHEQIGKEHNRSAEQTKCVMLGQCEKWKHRAVGSIRYEEIEQLLETIRDGDKDRKPTPYMANRLYFHLRHFFK